MNLKKKIEFFIMQLYQRWKIRENLKVKLNKKEIPKIQKEDQILIKNLTDGKYGVKIFLTTTKYCYDISKNLKDDVFLVDMQDANFNIMIQFQDNLNFPLNYELNEILKKHVFIFLFNLPQSLYLKEFLRTLEKQSQEKKLFTIVYCTDLTRDAQFLAKHFQFVG